MHISFDPAKDSANVAEHGVTLALATDLEWASAVVWPDLRAVYGEPRQVGLGYIDDRLFVVVFVERDRSRRIISLRKANQREERIYAKAQTDPHLRDRRRRRRHHGGRNGRSRRDSVH